MKAALVFLTVLGVVAAQLSSEYGPNTYTPKTLRNVYVYSAPDEPANSQSRVINVPGGDKHVNILFVKTPSSSSSHQTEVVLPEQDEHKNLVYVLLKKGSNSADVKITRPQAKTPQKPEVNFIRYGEDGPAGYGGGASASRGF